jgi:hypothetical protein
VAENSEIDGVLDAFAPATQFKLLSGSGDLTQFEFNKHMVQHQFCSPCGVQSFAIGTRPKTGEKLAAINVRCVDGVDVGALKVKKVAPGAFDKRVAARQRGRSGGARCISARN